ncbi:type I toxin-antitoxin system Ibs family toxin [Salmonella enterica]|nr:type I toxin-antitoxin system Ibs family toxin [Salmonella enterica]EJV1143833.1 type I toxin-antitoxin system Ibs family toxin [Salmonella enterica]HEC5806499.1 type I toxin-antitoxin system Ibs family toxin [Salmonella enterica subsp. enterica serovar Weltevreden]
MMKVVIILVILLVISF